MSTLIGNFFKLQCLLLVGSLEPDGVEQPASAVITPAMLEEEEQLEAAGLERERKMLEKVIQK